MAEVWKKPELNQSWLPNGEEYPGLIQEIREWTEERMRKPRDDFQEAVRELRLLFWGMNQDDASSQTSSPSVISGIYPGRSPGQ
jgi:hypothetical protein